MFRTLLAVVPVLWAVGCVPAQAPADGGPILPGPEPVRVPYVPLPGEPGYGQEQTVPLAGVAHAGGLREPRTVDPERYPRPTTPGDGETAGPARRWPWEARDLSRWERWFAVHGRQFLFARPVGAPSADGAAGDGVADRGTPMVRETVDLRGARRWLVVADDAGLRRSTALALAAWHADVVPDLVAAVKRATGDRSALIWALGTAGGPDAAATIGGLLDDPKTVEAERLLACVAYARAAGTDAVAGLSKLLVSSKASAALRGAAALSLGLTGDRSAVPGLTGLLASRDVEPRVRAAALCALTRLDPAAGRVRCTAILQRGSGPGADPLELRLAAAAALGATGRADAAEVLQATLTGQTGVPRFEREALLVACDELPRALADRCRPALLAAVDARGALSAAEVAQVAAEVVPPRERAGVAKRLRALLDRVGRAGIVEDESVRGLAGLGLGRCVAAAPASVRHRAVEALRAALTDDHYAVRGFAALGLALTGADGVHARLRELLRDADPAIRAAGAIALGIAADGGAAPALAQLARDGDPLQRWGAIWGLGIAHQPAALPVCNRLLDRRSHPDLRAAAASILTAVPGREAQALLERALDDRHATVRQEAARSLGLRAPASTVTATARALAGRALSTRLRTSALDFFAAAGTRHLAAEVADVLHGVPAEVVPELAGALLRTCEPAYLPTRH